MKTIKDLIAHLDAGTHKDLVADDLFTIKTAFYGDTQVVCDQKTVADHVDPDTTPGFILMCEFNDANLSDGNASVETTALRLKRIVEVFERLDLEVRYDCFDSYGSINDLPHLAFVQQMCFETDEDIIRDVIRPIVDASGILNAQERAAEFSMLDEAE